MANTLLNNSYRILGLDNSASIKEINKRSKDIINLLAIDEKPHYGLDFDIQDNLRTESKLKEAAQNLSNPRKKIIDYFFWFDIQDSIDQKAGGLIEKMDTVGAREVWTQAIASNTPKKDFYKKNLAILDLFILSEKDAKYSLEESLKFWKELLSSDKFWSDFVKIYKLNDDLDTSSEVIDNFRNNASSTLSDIYADLGEKNKNDLYLTEFIKSFGAKGENVDKNVLTPLYQEINKNLTILEQIKPEPDKMIEPDIKTKIKKTIKNIELSFNEIVKLGIYEDSQTIVLRDKVAMAIRSLALVVNDIAKDYKVALDIIESAPLFAATELEKSRANDNLLIIRGNVAGLELNDVLELVNKGDFEEAILVVNNKLENEKLSKEAKTQLEEFKRSYEERVKTFGKPVKNAPTMFTLWGFGTSLYGDTLFLTAFWIPVLPIARYVVEKQWDGRFLFRGKLPLTPKQVIWFWVALLLIIGYVLFSMNNSSSNTSTTNTNNTTNNQSSTDCSNVPSGSYCCSSENSKQSDALKPDPTEETKLQNMYSKLNNDKLYLDNTNQYSVSSYNAEVDQYNLEKDTYNNQLQNYNNFLKNNCELK
jgi:hypothetical protein